MTTATGGGAGALQGIGAIAGILGNVIPTAQDRRDKSIAGGAEDPALKALRARLAAQNAQTAMAVAASQQGVNPALAQRNAQQALSQQQVQTNAQIAQAGVGQAARASDATRSRQTRAITGTLQGVGALANVLGTQRSVGGLTAQPGDPDGMVPEMPTTAPLDSAASQVQAAIAPVIAPQAPVIAPQAPEQPGNVAPPAPPQSLPQPQGIPQLRDGPPRQELTLPSASPGRGQLATTPMVEQPPVDPRMLQEMAAASNGTDAMGNPQTVQGTPPAAPQPQAQNQAQVQPISPEQALAAIPQEVLAEPRNQAMIASLEGLPEGEMKQYIIRALLSSMAGAL